jgi:hypothetical protein
MGHDAGLELYLRPLEAYLSALRMVGRGIRSS